MGTHQAAPAHVGIIGGGFCGLAAAYKLGRIFQPSPGPRH